ncbi:hypothetical protein ACIBKX_40355 [Streptomyces sp. NPDC050658]|uniref:hypothetical protein n=1 Tax=unclassified Streptomyces TaxID=2593676 RepID=UPI003435137B
MIRLPSNHAAITAPLAASNAAFPGIEIGRSTSDGRLFRLSPVLVDAEILPSTNSIALGGLGSGKSTTAKIRARREIRDHDHQYVILDSYGEQQHLQAEEGEWARLTRDLGGQVIQAGEFALNPCSPLFTPEVREQLIRSLIAAVEPKALNQRTAHALQHALNSPKSSTLSGLVDALQAPEAGRYSARKLTDWGEGIVLALTHYTDGALRGLFDGPNSGLPETDLPIISFDFTKLDKNSPAIPALMAAITCWVEHVWLKQSTAIHRHLVLEEAWQILLSPATAELIQRLLKNSRKAALSLDVVMHTLSDLGDGRAKDLARLCEIAHVGRLGPKEAAKVGALLSLPDWAVEKIGTLDPGQAVWKVGPDHVDIVQTVLTEEEIALTDTSTRRRKAQEQALSVDHGQGTETEQEQESETVLTLVKEPAPEESEEAYEHDGLDADAGQDFKLPPNVVDTLDPRTHDSRHHAALQAAHDGRLNEAANIAAVGEREDITAHGINSIQAVAWLVTRADIAELAGSPGQAAQLRATVARMGNDRAEWFETTDSQAPQWHQVPDLPNLEPSTGEDDTQARARRRTWPYVAAIAALTLTAAGVWQSADSDHKEKEREQKAGAYKGRSGANLVADSVDADVVARWTRDRDSVIVELSAAFESNAKYLRIDSGRKSAVSQPETGRFAESPQIVIPVKDPYADVTVNVAIGGKSWKEGTRATTRTIRLSPTGVAYDAETDKQLPSDL